MVEVKKVESPEELEVVWEIRQQVFVREQGVSEAEEYDGFEQESTHFLATLSDSPAGTCRWRFTSLGVKLERFAVSLQFRKHGVGHALMQAALADIATNQQADGKLRYLHAQLGALDFYVKEGFIASGDLFYEAGIPHYKMALPL